MLNEICLFSSIPLRSNCKDNSFYLKIYMKETLVLKWARDGE